MQAYKDVKKCCFHVDVCQIVSKYKYDMWLASILGVTRSN